MSRSRATTPVQSHRANPATANCAMWLSPEQLAERHAVHTAAGRKLDGEIPCVCGNHNRRMYV
jgi:hypothetical protein